MEKSIKHQLNTIIENLISRGLFTTNLFLPLEEYSKLKHELLGLDNLKAKHTGYHVGGMKVDIEIDNYVGIAVHQMYYISVRNSNMQLKVKPTSCFNREYMVFRLEMPFMKILIY